MKYILILLILSSSQAYSKSPEGKGMICAFGKKRNFYETYLFFENKEKKQPKNKRPFAIAFIVAPVLLLCLGANFIRHCLE